MKADILFGMLLTLLNKRQVTAKYLANRYEMSVRSVYRYIDILALNNIPIQTKTGKNGGIMLTNSILLNSTYFTMKEKFTLLALSQSIQDQQLKISIQTKLLSLR